MAIVLYKGRSSTGCRAFLLALAMYAFVEGSNSGLTGRIAEATGMGASQDSCPCLCAAPCLKPWTIPDRWHDRISIPGHMPGDGKANWFDNGQWDAESFEDINGNRIYDFGERFDDSNGNGVYDQEYYSPLITGYVPDPSPAHLINPNGDAGAELVLKAAQDDRTTPGQFFIVSFPPRNKGEPAFGGDRYRENLLGCSPWTVGGGDELILEPGFHGETTERAVRVLLERDPYAYWDPVDRTIKGSAHSVSPRILLVPLHDPRIPASSGRGTVVVNKIVAFFLERVELDGTVVGRLVRHRGSGIPCPPGVAPCSGFLFGCP